MVAEDDRGVTINGLKMLGTATVFCHETWCGNLQPVAPGQEKESITCVVPLNAPGVSIWSRKSYEQYAVSEFDNPLAAASTRPTPRCCSRTCRCRGSACSATTTSR